MALRVLVAMCLVVPVSACSSSGSSVSGGVDLDGLLCEPVAGAGLGDVDICVDTGIRSESLFSFSNWANRRYRADDFGLAEMVALFGEDAVCERLTGTTCQPTSKSLVLREAINKMLMNGRCEGLTVLAGLYMTKRGPDPSQFGAGSVTDLTPANDDLTNIIDYWWGTQFLSTTIDKTSETKKSGVQGVLTSVISGLADSAGVTVGIYSEDGAHSVLPVAVTRTSKSEFGVIVWDPNLPSVLGRIEIDLTARTWRYRGGRLNPSEPPKEWSGSDGSIDATVLSSRNGEPRIRLDEANRGDASVLATSTPGRSLSVSITTSTGRTLVASRTGSTGAVPGVAVTPLRNGGGEQLLLSIPQSIGEFSVAVRSSGTTGELSDGSVRVTVDNGGPDTMSVETLSANDDVELSVGSGIDGNGEPVFTATSSARASVTVATAASVLSIGSEPDSTVSVASSTKDGVAAVVTVTDGGEVRSTSIPAAPAGAGTQEVVVTTSASGELKFVNSVVTAVAVDTRKIQGTVAQAEKNTPSGAVVPAVPSPPVFDVRNTLGKVTSDSFNVTTAVTPASAATVWVEYGPDLDWSTILKSPPQTVTEAGAGNVETNVPGLRTGTKYRFRSAASVEGTVRYTPFAQFVTGGPPTAVTVPIEPVDVTSSHSDVSQNGAKVSWTVSPLSNVTTWVEYGPKDSGAPSVFTAEQVAVANKETSLTAELKGLSDATTYRYRVAVAVRGRLVRSPYKEFTTEGKKTFTPSTEPSIEVALAVTAVSETGALVAVTTSSEVNSRLQLSYGTSAPTTAADTVYVQAGEKVKTEVAVTGLPPSTNHEVRVVVTSPAGKEYVATGSFTTERAGSVLGVPTVPILSVDKTEFETVLSRPVVGALRFEYGVNNTSIEPFVSAAVDTNDKAVTYRAGPSKENPLPQGIGARVRAVLTTSYGVFTTQFRMFTAPGSLNLDSFRASKPNVTVMPPGLYVWWTLSAKSTPTNLTFRVFDGTRELCRTINTAWACNPELQSPSIVSGVTVVSYLDGVEIRRSETTTELTP